MAKKINWTKVIGFLGLALTLGGQALTSIKESKELDSKIEAAVEKRLSGE